MKRNNLVLGLLGLLFVAFACTEDELDTYSGGDSVYFKWALDGYGENAAAQEIDSTSITFAYDFDDVVDTIFSVPVKLQGRLVSYDREVTLGLKDRTTAVEGVNYTLPESIIIPADSIEAEIPITIYRTEELKDTILILVLSLEPNEEFDTNIWSDTTVSDVLFDEFEISISDILVEPSAWSTVGKFLGPFSAKKLTLFAEVNDIPIPNYDADGLPEVSIFLGQVDVFEAYLEDQALAGTPVYEEDGTLMTTENI